MSSKRIIEKLKEDGKLGHEQHWVEKSLNLELNTPGPESLWYKTYPLQIVVVNLDPKATLLLEQDWFYCGDFWEQPFWNIGPYQFQTFSVCEGFSYRQTDSDCGSICRCVCMCLRCFCCCCSCCEEEPRLGVSGGVGFLVETAGKTSSTKQMFICTFANPGIGPIQARCDAVDVGPTPKGKEVKAVWEKMKAGAWIRSPRCGFYKGNLPSSTGVAAEFGNQKLVFVWKSESVMFDEILAAKATQKHDFAKQTAGNEHEL